MKIFKKILRILVLTHIFPLCGIFMAKDENTSILDGYLTGWGINLIFIGAIGIIVFLMWLFVDNDYEDNYYP